MHDIKWIRENPQAFDEGLKKRGLEPQSETILALDEERRDAQTRAQQTQEERNKLNKEIGIAKAKGEDASFILDKVRITKTTQEERENRLRDLNERFRETIGGIPNLPGEGVPEGADEAANAEVATWGEKPDFGFEPKEHYEIGEALGAMDFERAAKLSGSRFVLLTGPLARLERALAQFMLDLQTIEFGYNEVSPPVLVRSDALFGTGQLPKFSDDLFRVHNINLIAEARKALLGQSSYVAPLDQTKPLTIQDVTDKIQEISDHVQFATQVQHWLIPTAEVPLTNLVAGEILEEDALPLRFTAHTGCFRAEAGAAGKDTRGMLRQHQFYKVELVSIAHPDHSDEEHERMTGAAETVLQRLGLHYRKMVLATGDMGFSARKTYDLEVWLPGQGAYREISSCSNCGDFQARRMNARFRPKEGPKGGRGTRFVHTLNGSGLAVGRTLIAVLENYQREDGTVAVPEALRPYMGGIETIGPGGPADA